MTGNPVLRRELIERWRGRRAFVVLTVHVALLAGFVQTLSWMANSQLQSGWWGLGGASAGPVIGRFLYENVVGALLLLVLFIAPGYAAAQISGERERRSLPLLQVTLLRPRQIVLGKLGAATAWLVLLVVAALPFGAVAFFLGGVTVADLLRATAYIVAVAVAIAAVGLGLSSLVRRTTGAVVLTYAVVLALVVGSLFAAGVEAFVSSRDGDGVQRPRSLYLNPFYGLADAARAQSVFSGPQLPSIMSPFAVALPGGEMFEEHRMVGVDDGVGPAMVVGEPDGSGAWPVWLATLTLYALLGLAGVVVATRRVRAGGVAARLRPAPRPAGGEAAT